MTLVPHRPWHEPWWDSEDAYGRWPASDAPAPLGVDVEPRTEEAVILGPDGEPLSILLDRQEVPFGFTAGNRTPTAWRRL
jgi:hypothetical protein